MLAALHAKPLSSVEVQTQKQEIMDAIALESSHARINLLDLLWDRSKLKTGRRLRIAFLWVINRGEVCDSANVLKQYTCHTATHG